MTLVSSLIVWLHPFLPAYHTAVAPGWAGEAAGWSCAGSQGSVISNEALSGELNSWKFTVSKTLLHSSLMLLAFNDKKSYIAV